MPGIIDLTLPLRPGLRGVEVEPKYRLDTDGWNAATWHIYSHAGTHMDARLHFGCGDETIDRHDPERCMGPARVVRIEAVEPKQELQVADLGELVDAFPAGESLLLNTGWSRYVDDPARYRDALPGISEELAVWCVDHRVKLLGVEPPSVADVSNLETVTRIHRILLNGGVTIVEGLTNLDRLRRPSVFFLALPLPLAGGDGCPVRAIAWDTPPDQWPPC